ncbi:MAG: hypothetical protein QW079_02345, partial [Nitrososphaerota archaeon]
MLLERLQTELSLVKKKIEYRDRACQLIEQIKTVKEEIGKIKEEVKNIREKMEPLLEKQTKLREKIQELKSKADQWHQKYIEVKNILQQLEAKKILVSSQIIELQNILKKHREVEEAKKFMEIREKLKNEAKAKLISGKKLTFEEFKILLEDGELAGSS